MECCQELSFLQAPSLGGMNSSNSPITVTKVRRDAGNEKYYKKFDFFYRRTAFRTMTEYFKGLFRPNLDRWRELDKKLLLALQEN